MDPCALSGCDEIMRHVQKTMSVDHLAAVRAELKVVLNKICELEELKKSTVVTTSILSTAKSLALENEEKLVYISVLLAQLRSEYSGWIRGVQRFKLAATKRDKLWTLFHKYSLNERYHACMRCDKSLGLNAHEIFWQLFLEKKFLQQISDGLCETSSTTVVASTTRDPSDVEENAIRYLAGYVIRKMVDKYAKLRTSSAIECTAALREMGGQLCTRRGVSSHHSGSWTYIVDRGGLYHVEDIVYHLFLVYWN